MIKSPDSFPAPTFVAFRDGERIAKGSLSEAALAAKRALGADRAGRVLVFNAGTGEVADLDLRGADADVRDRYAPEPEPPAKRGRPKLGVVAREVTLLPRHWAWLSAQPGGASVALRKLVEAARKEDGTGGQGRLQINAAYRFMAAMAGDLPGFEEAARALFAGTEAVLRAHMRPWPADIARQVLEFLHPAEM